MRRSIMSVHSRGGAYSKDARISIFDQVSSAEMFVC
jgi:hypothetical protein